MILLLNTNRWIDFTRARSPLTLIKSSSIGRIVIRVK